MMRVTAVGMVVLCAWGCGATAPVAEKRDALLVFPSTPTELTTMRPPYLPPSLRSAYVVAISDPRDPNDFLAWAFDVKAPATVFFVHGNRATQWPAFTAQISQDMLILTTHSTVPDGSTCTVTQWTGNPPTPRPGGTDFHTLGQTAYTTAHDLSVAMQAFGP